MTDNKKVNLDIYIDKLHAAKIIFCNFSMYANRILLLVFLHKVTSSDFKVIIWVTKRNCVLAIAHTRSQIFVNSGKAFDNDISLVKQQFVVTHRIRRAEIPALLDS